MLDLLRFAAPYRRAAILAMIFVSISVGMSLVAPVLYRGLIDEGLRHGDEHLVAVYAALIVAAVFAGALSEMVEEFFSCRFALRMMNDVRNRLYRHLNLMPMAFYLATPPGPIINRFTTDLLNVQKVVARTLPAIVTNVLLIVCSLAMMLWLSWQLTVVTLIALPVYGLIAVAVSRAVGAATSTAISYGDHLINTLGEDFSLQGYLFFKLWGISSVRGQEFEALTSRIQTARLHLGLWMRANSAAINMVQALGVVAVYYVGGLDMVAGQTSMGTVIAFATIATRLYQPIAFFSTSVSDLPAAVLSMRRILDYLQQPAVPRLATSDARPLATPIVDTPFSVVVDRLSFSYPGNEGQLALHDVSFKLRRGERVAIVGPNGCGKSTLLMLLAGLHEPAGGSMSLLGRAAEGMSQQEIAGVLSVGLSNDFFLNATVRENLRIVKPDVGDDELQRALSRSGCDQFIAALPQGLDTLIGQSGLQLSSGQRQRLSLARMFLRAAPIVVLDESTSNLDGHAEDFVLDALAELPASATVLLVTHSAKVARRLPRVLVFDQGRLVGDGHHEEVMRRCTAYRRLLGADQTEPLIERVA